MRSNIMYAAAGILLASVVTILHTIPALADDGQYVTGISGYNSSRVYFQSQQGADYILYAYGNGTVSIINPTSGPSPVLHPANYNELEAQFRAIYTASYGLDIQPSGYTQGNVYTDCRDDVKTTCQLTASRSQHGSILTRGDRDWFRVSLRKGQRYQFALTASQQVTLTLRNPKGSLIQRSLNGTNGGTAFANYKAPATGTYFAAASVVSYGTDYDLSVR